MATITKRTSLEGNAQYQVKVRLKGHPTQSATFERLTDARKWASSTESAIREGRYFKTNESRKHTLADMVDRYIRDISPLKRTGKKQESQLMWWKEQIGPYALADVTPAMIAECRDRLLSSPQRKGVKKLSGPTVNRYLAALSHAFSVCVKEWGWLEDSPMRRVKKFKENRGIVRFLSEEERHSFLCECRASPNKALYPVVILGISTGMRRSEIMYLYWREPKIPPSGAWGVVDLDRNRIVLHMTKNGERRLVPLVGHAFDCLKAMNKVRRLDTDLVFPAKNPPTPKCPRQLDSAEKLPIRPVDLRDQWNRALLRAGIEGFRFHDLRHTCASYLAMNNASLSEIAETLGHKTLQMVKRYSHLSEAHTATVLTRMNAAIFGNEELITAHTEEKTC